MLAFTSHPSTWPLIPLVPRSDTRWPTVASKSCSAILLAVETVTVVAVANGIRPEAATSLTTKGGGGMMKSSAETAVPIAVLIVIRPDVVLLGTGTVTDVAVDAVGALRLLLNRV